jgi:hypothetical protein
MGPVLVSRFNEHGNQVGYYAIKSSILTKTKINFYPKPGISILLHIIDRLRVSDHKGGRERITETIREDRGPRMELIFKIFQWDQTMKSQPVWG